MVILLLGIVLGSLVMIYKNNIGPVKSGTEDISFTIEQGDTYMSIAPVLEENELIKSEFFYKIYVKLHNPTDLKVGNYSLNADMGVAKIVEVLSGDARQELGEVVFTIPEGWHFEDIAEYGATVTTHSADTLMSAWQDSEFLNEVINKYWFVTDEILNPNIRYALEGYLFPSTYYISSTLADPEEIAYTMLDQMDKVLSEYRTDIENSGYTVHQILTMASIIEHEAILDEDRSTIASVFYNRLNSGMALQSCATLGYATGDWKLTYTYDDMEIDSPYNTYLYDGLPVGPGGMPGEASIVAAINPASSDYYYFMANVCDESASTTYYATTYEQHQANIDKYLTC